MSGIVGILSLDGAPVDRDLLERMTELMEFRGPDGRATWVDGQVGFGHALLATTDESADERQPCSLDGRVWITADARVDGRRELIQKLEARGHAVRRGAPDVELILHAYHVWGEACVQHLIGDFAFAIWDSPNRRLFCARDHFGVKPFYYAQVGRSVVFSNTLNCLRSHPAVSDELNDLAIADFLLFDYNQEPSTTTFADIKRLPPAHTLTWSSGAPGTSRYWSLPVADSIRYRDPSEYVDRFRELLRTAVADRMRTRKIGVSMSGGLDSTALAAMAGGLSSEHGESPELRAYTAVYDRLMPDQERHYAGLVGKSLGIPVQFLAVDDYDLYERWDQLAPRQPEPNVDPLGVISADLLDAIAAENRVALTGDGGDPILLPSTVLDLLETMPRGRLLGDVAWSVLRWRRVPRIGIRSRVDQGLRPTSWDYLYPSWLNPDLATRLDLPGRWAEVSRQSPPAHPTRSAAYRNVTAPYWPFLFENWDAGVTSKPVDVRHPFFDLRVVTYALAVPPIPWCVDKLLLRLATRGMLPEAVRLRRKSPLVSDPRLARLRQPGGAGLEPWTPVPDLEKYVDGGAVPEPCENDDPLVLWANLRARSLNYWLRYSRSFRRGDETWSPEKSGKLTAVPS